MKFKKGDFVIWYTPVKCKHLGILVQVKGSVCMVKYLWSCPCARRDDCAHTFGELCYINIGLLEEVDIDIPQEVLEAALSGKVKKR